MIDTAAYAPAVLLLRQCASTASAHCRGRKLRRAKEDGERQKSEVRDQRSEGGGKKSDVRSRRSESGEKMNIEHRTSNVQHRMKK